MDDAWSAGARIGTAQDPREEEADREALRALLAAVSWRRRLVVCGPEPERVRATQYWREHGFLVLAPNLAAAGGPVEAILLTSAAVPHNFAALVEQLPEMGLVWGPAAAAVADACRAAGLVPGEPLGAGGRQVFRKQRPVHVVVPVYGAVAYLEQCLAALAATTVHCPVSLAIIDDATPDAADAARIAQLAASWPGAAFIRHQDNRGFPATANEGIARRPAGSDVVLLNSDAVVTPHWLSKLAEAAWSRPAVATATPLSNWAADLSIPCSLRLADQCSAFLQSRPAGASRWYPEVPSGVGFCLYIRSEALEAVGALDEAFGLGYGEEVDFCRRARAQGFANLLDDRTFVFHYGHRSMDEHGVVRDTTMGSSAADEELLRRHPDLRLSVKVFLAAGHVAEVRRAWEGQLRIYRPKRKPRLWLQLWGDPHQSSGGVESTSRTLVELLSPLYEVLVSWTDAARVYLEEPAESLRERQIPRSSWPFAGVSWDGGRVVRTPVLVADWADMLRRYRVDVMYVVHMLGAAPVAVAAAKSLGLPVLLAVHDYAALCPDYTLMGPEARHCGAPDDPDGCRACLAAKPELKEERRPRWGDIRRWRSDSQATMALADRIEYPSTAAQAQVEAVLGPSPAVVIPPWREFPRRPLDLADPERVVVVLGYQGVQKGEALLRELVPALVAAGIGVHFVGTAGRQWPTLQNVAGVSFGGADAPREVFRRLAASKAFAALLPSAFAETYSLTLSESWMAGLPAVVSPFGAPADRVRETGAGVVARSYTAAAFVEAAEAVWQGQRQFRAAAQRAAAGLASRTAYGAQHLYVLGQLMAGSEREALPAAAPPH